jgi:hypothetical protein
VIFVGGSLTFPLQQLKPRLLVRNVGVSTIAGLKSKAKKEKKKGKKRTKKEVGRDLVGFSHVFALSFAVIR